ncbi:MAG: hypothetical protein WDO56_03590 [Gammaproteobacteria bacterium]
MKALGIEEFRKQVETEWLESKDFATHLDLAEVVARARVLHAAAVREARRLRRRRPTASSSSRPGIATNTRKHKVPGYRAVFGVTQETPATVPGDMTSEQMEAVRRSRR